MRKRKRFLAMSVAAFLVCSSLPVQMVEAGTIEQDIWNLDSSNVEKENITTRESTTGNLIDQGTIGENLSWTLNKNNLLTISGTGEMMDFYSTVPWDSYRKIIKDIILFNSNI